MSERKLLEEAIEFVDLSSKGICVVNFTLADRLRAHLKSGGWISVKGAYLGEVAAEYPECIGPDGRKWLAQMESVKVLLQVPYKKQARIGSLWLDTNNEIIGTFPYDNAIGWQPLPPLPGEKE